VVGADRVATSVLVAGQFFTDPTAVGIATSERFPDALTGGVHVAARGGPMLLAPPTTVPTVLRDYLCAHEDVIDETFLYGGPLVISEVVREVVVSLTSGAAC